jgi:hypothetical protein
MLNLINSLLKHISSLLKPYQPAVKLISFLSMLTLSLLELSRIKEGDGISIETVQLVIEVDKQVDKSGQHVVDADHFDMSCVPAVTY